MVGLKRLALSSLKLSAFHAVMTLLFLSLTTWIRQNLASL